MHNLTPQTLQQVVLGLERVAAVISRQLVLNGLCREPLLALQMSLQAGHVAGALLQQTLAALSQRRFLLQIDKVLLRHDD